MLLDEKGDLTIKAARGIEPELAQTVRVKVGEYICGRVAAQKTPLLVNDIDSDEELGTKRTHKYKTKSFMSFPVLMKDKLLGVININDKIDGSFFTEDEFDLINVLASQTAIALEHALLMSELRSKALELDERNKGLIDIDKLKTEFIARMSHELRTPLNSITGAVYYLKEKKTSQAEQSEFVNIISDEANKLINLLDGLLNFSRLERDEVLFRKKVINLKDVIEEVIDAKIVRDVLTNSKISIRSEYSETLSDIVGEKVRLLQSFIHLIVGITKYIDPGGSIEIRSIDTEHAVQVEIFVEGQSIPENDLPFVFDERSLWYAVDVDQNKLKLYLAKKTIELHEGSISVSNEPEGISVMITFSKSSKEYRDAEISDLTHLFLSFTAELMNLNRCSLLLSDNLTGDMTIRSSIGIDEETVRKTRIKMGHKVAGWVAMEKQPLLIEDIETDARIGRRNGNQYSTKSLLCIPININNHCAGVLNLNNKVSGQAFDKKDLYLASVVAERISNMISRVQEGDLGEKEFKMMTRDMEALLTAERQYNKKNGRTADLVFGIMERMGRSEEEIKLALYVSSLYDLGLTQIDESIISKTKTLSSTERKIIKTHPFPGAALIEHLEKGGAVRKIILHHHEKHDGSGYPDGLAGDEIPFISKVISVVDTYTAMTADRPYRTAISNEEAVEEIRKASGTHFDPAIVDSFLETVSR
jgi:HD-GYP domain-containing protein (c-di-GMP phosphodiesterase class II)/signal transduction histidine kinase